MGLDLFNTTVESTYDGLLKTSDNDNITGVAKQITDGNGNNTPLWISTTRIGVGLTPDAGYDFTTNLGKFTTIDATTVNASFVGNLTGNADTATKWATARTITLNGDVSGSTSIDGSLNVSITAVVANDSHTHDTRYYTETEIDATLTNYQLISEKGAALGYAPLDSGAKIAEAYLPDSVLGQVEYQGTWDASLNTPTLPDPTTVKGHFYIVSVAGNYLTIDYQVGDWIISNGVDWSKVDNTDAVTTFNGRLGSIVPLSADYDSFFYTKTLLDAGQLDNRYYTETELDAGQLDNRYYTETELTNGQLDTRYYTETEIGNFFSGTTAITGYNKTNWDTAYGWGNWATGVTKAFVDALNVDADTLDSLNSTDFLRSNANDTYSGDLTVDYTTGFTLTDGTYTGDLTVDSSNRLNWNGSPLVTDVIAGQYVVNTGDTMTGSLTIENTAPLYKLKDNNSTGATDSYGQIQWLDSVDTIIGRIGFYGADSKFYIDANGSDVYIGDNLQVNGSISKVGGTSSQFLKADGSVDSNSYLTSYTETDTLASVTARGNTSSTKIVINSTGTANSPTLRLNNSSSSTFIHSYEAFGANMIAGQHNIQVFGKVGNTKNAGYIGYYWAGDASNSNFVTIGHWGNDDLFRVYADGNVTVGTNQVIHAGNYTNYTDSKYLRSDTSDTMNGSLSISGGNGLYFTASNSRIYYNGYRALEGNTTGTNLQIGEGYSVTRMYGKVGIGIAAAEVLDLQASSGDTRIRLNAAAGSDTEIKFFNDGVAQYTIGHDDATDNFVIGGANVDAPLVNITKAGNVGVGQTSPSSLLHVGNGSGVILSAGANTWADTTVLSNGWTSGVGDWLKIEVPSSDNEGGFIQLNSNGNVGIGTTSPNSQLHINESTANTNCAAIIQSASWDATLQLQNANGTWEILNDYTGLGTTGALAFYNSGYRMVIDNTGKVGIGTTSPSMYGSGMEIKTGSQSGLRVSSTTAGGGAIELGADTGSGYIQNVVVGDSTHFYTSNVASADTLAMTINSSGNVGIGTPTPDRELDLVKSTDNCVMSITSGTTNVSGIVLGDTADDDRGGMLYNNTSEYLYFLVNAGEGMRLTSTKDLHVDGNIIGYSTTISDKRFKDEVKTIENALELTKRMRGAYWTWNAGSKKGTQSFGHIAQEVENITPDIVKEIEMPLMDSSGKLYKTIESEQIIGIHTEAIKQLADEKDADIAKKDREIANLQRQIDDLKELIKSRL